ncbi:MAG: efflux RND transporter periplasmic adaptor subunit [Pseudomonadota bacterium]
MFFKLIKFVLPLAVIALAIMGTIALYALRQAPEQRPPEPAVLLVDTVQPEINRDRFVVQAQGTVQPRTETTLVAEVSGRITSLSDAFVAGGFFRAGTELARIDPSDYETALLAAEADLAAARANLADEQARSDAARDDFRRLYGDAREPNDLVLRLPQLARAEASVQAQQASVQRARRNLERTRIQLPYDGMIMRRNVDLGQFVNTGANLGVAFAVDVAEVRLPVSDRDLAFVGVPLFSQGVELNVPVTLRGRVAGQTAEWPAILTRTEGIVDENTRLTFLVAEVIDPYGLIAGTHNPGLPMGTYVEAAIAGRNANGLMVVPSQALNNGNQVLIANDDNELEVRDVQIVRSTPNHVYVDGNLGPDERIITTAIAAPVPGLKLRIRGEPTDAELAAPEATGDLQADEADTISIADTDTST